MVSPTGQLIAPATIPGFMLVDFISSNLEEAKNKANIYKRYEKLRNLKIIITKYIYFQ